MRSTERAVSTRLGLLSLLAACGGGRPVAVTGSADESTTTSGGSAEASDGSGESEGEPTACPGGVVPGDVRASTQEEVDALEGCILVAGELRIVGDAVVSLQPLSSLEFVGDGLWIGEEEGVPGPLLASLAGLENLQAVGGDLTLAALPQLQDIGALSRLTVIPGALTVADAPLLTSLEGLHQIREVWLGLGVGELPGVSDLQGLRALESVGSHVWLTDLDGLSDLHGLDALSEVGQPGVEPLSFSVAANEQLTSLSGLDSVAWHAGVQINVVANPQLVDLSALQSASALDALRIAGNDSLLDLDGLSNLETVDGALELDSNPKLQNLDALAGLFSVGELRLNGEQPLDDLSGLDSLLAADIVELTYTDLVDLGPLPALSSVSTLEIRENDLLVELSGLEGVASAHTIRVHQNPLLPDLAGLAGLTTVGAELDVRQNAALASLADLSALTSVDGRLEVILNDALAQDEALMWAVPVSVTGLTKIDGNLGAPPNVGGCPWQNDGECDESEGTQLCEDGTDPEDCPDVPGE